MNSMLDKIDAFNRNTNNASEEINPSDAFLI